MKYESILCDLCQHLVHPNCNNIDRSTLESLGNETGDWFCKTCNYEIFPHFLLENNKRDSIITSTVNNTYITHDDCSVCHRLVTGSNTLACGTCRHWVHKNCIGHFKDRAEYQNFLYDYNDKHWDCPECLSDMLPFIKLDDDEFRILLLENMYSPIAINNETFKELYLSLQKMDFLNSIDKDDKFFNDIDPDVNFTTMEKCNYILDTEKLPDQTQNQLYMMTFNLRSIRMNFEKFTTLLNSVERKIHIISITESWLSEKDNIVDYTLPGYHPPLYQNRNTHGGGVITYIHEDIKTFKINKTASYLDEYNHFLATDITINNKSMTILNIYRSPSESNNVFQPKLEEILGKIGHKLCYILGDFNFNLINSRHHSPTDDFLNLMTANYCKPLITKPTRITSDSATLIDNIWTNDITTESKITSYIIITDISDHLPCMTIIESDKLNLKGYKTIQKRIIDDERQMSFRKDIERRKHILDEIIKNSHLDVDGCYTKYFEEIKDIYNSNFPIVKKKIHNKAFSKPWMNEEILKLIKKKNKLYSRKVKSDSKDIRSKFKAIKRELEDKIKSEKRSYYMDLLSKKNKTCKERWDTIRSIINRKRPTQTCMVANDTLGKHYSTVAKKLADGLPNLSDNDIPTTSSTTECITNHRFNFSFVQERNVYENIIKLDVNKGPGIDELDVKSTKMIADILSPHLTILFNHSIHMGIYPDIFKTARCVPIFKGIPLDPEEPINYRPISVLNTINKVFERLIHEQLVKYLERNNLLPGFQYGYRKRHSTSQAILDYTDHIIRTLNQRCIAISVFMDLSKAFDTVSKDILKQKLKQLGLLNESTKLIDSYMSNRKFCLKKDEQHFNLEYGVPQGSILGPLLFIVYTFDMINISRNNKVIVYADDTTVVITGRNLTEAKQHTNDILERFYKYFTLNKLSINPSKTKYMVYLPRFRLQKNHCKTQDCHNIDLIMHDKVLSQVKSIRFLGLMINDKLTWDMHKKHIVTKVNRTLGILYKTKPLMNEYNLVNMYKTFVEPYFLYGIEIWGHSVKSEKDPVKCVQNKAIRIVYDCYRSADAWSQNDRIQTIEELYRKVITRTCYKHHSKLLPKYFAENKMPNLMYYDEKRPEKTRNTLNNMLDYRHLTKNDTNYNNPFITDCIHMWNEQTIDEKRKPYEHHWNRVVGGS